MIQKLLTIFSLLAMAKLSFAETYLGRHHFKKIELHSLIDLFPKNSKVKDLTEKFLIIEIHKSLTNDEILNLKLNPKIDYIILDTLIEPAYLDENCSLKQYPFVYDDLVSTIDWLDFFKGIGSPFDQDCFGESVYSIGSKVVKFESPPQIDERGNEIPPSKDFLKMGVRFKRSMDISGRSIDLDLAKEIFKNESDKDAQNVKTAVFDTGFAKDYEENMIRPVETKIAKDVIGVHQDDEHGHGTSVASIFLGQDIGISPNTDLRVTRISPEHTSNMSFNQTMVEMSEACDDGYRILNLSYTGTFIEDRYIDELRKKGCLVFKSAGNPDSKHVDTNYFREDDGLIYIEAHTTSGERAKDYGVGEVGALGIETPVIRNNGDKGLMSGSSFSSPLIAAASAMTLGHLMNFPKFNNLSLEDQSIFMERLIKASALKGSVNAAKMAKMAMNWVNDDSITDLPTITDFRMNVEKPCNDKSERKCFNIVDCNELKKCMNYNKDILLFCYGVDKDEIINDLARTYFIQGEMDSMLMLKKYLSSEDAKNYDENLNKFLNTHGKAAIMIDQANSKIKNEEERSILWSIAVHSKVDLEAFETFMDTVKSPESFEKDLRIKIKEKKRAIKGYEDKKVNAFAAFFISDDNDRWDQLISQSENQIEIYEKTLNKLRSMKDPSQNQMIEIAKDYMDLIPTLESDEILSQDLNKYHKSLKDIHNKNVKKLNEKTAPKKLPKNFIISVPDFV